MGSPHGGMAGQGYSYSTLTSSMDLGHVDGPGGRMSRNRAVANLQHGSRQRVDRRYSPPPTRKRQGTGPSSPPAVYTSLQSSLPLPRTAPMKGSSRPTNRRTETASNKDKDKDRAHLGLRHLTNLKQAKPKSKKQRRPDRPERIPPVKKSSRRRSITKKGPEDRLICHPISVRSTRSKSTGCDGPASVASKKAAPQKSTRKPKGTFWWSCF